ncbi:helix-turn-helix transcriptional regulator [Candidatus Halobonum tyrrellensis]|uniref:Uncharacterized protein n=1 Tax=Candidatus Halobonum tyrrellensis G22 TaxID=1324957 RepID=V4HE02_9EURY|nr:hypothetical protein [Candidatus Halobonum tyrrellensis]ESP88890.1 hypothetical protein K933_06388 [Candidatus Halobonum tyrrellensis G22]
MSTDDTATALFETALRRSSFLDCLDEEPTDKRTLVAELDCSRSTVNRGVRELEAAELVEYDDGGYRTTPLGRRIVEGFAELAADAAVWTELEPFLRWVPEEELGFDLTLLDDAEVVVPDPGDPYGVINRHVGRLREMDEGRFLLPFTGLHAAETVHERVVDHGADCEVVVAPSVARTFRDDEYAPVVAEMADAGGFRVFRASEALPLSLGVVDDRVQFIAAEGQEPRALVETERREVREWAEETFEACKREAEPVTFPSASGATSGDHLSPSSAGSDVR